MAVERRGEPVWVLILIGWMAVQAAQRWPLEPPPEVAPARNIDVTRASPREPPAEVAPVRNIDVTRASPRDPPAEVAPVRNIDVTRGSPRDLRALPGVGELKALAIARERWKLRGTARALDLDALPGIGPKTAAAIRRNSLDLRDASDADEALGR